MADLASALRESDPNNGQFDPSLGQVQLQKYDRSQFDPETSTYKVSNVSYTIPKDSIKTFVANTNDSGQADSSLGGQYILNDGSTMSVDGNGTVQFATPARNEYTLNKDGYYQPTGSDLTWNGQANLLTKNIGGVDVQVPGMYTKGGYQDAQGNLRTDANGVPVALAPNYLDSGLGKSGLSDAAPYIAAAAMAAMTMGASAPESATLAGGEAAGAAAGTGATETAGTIGGTTASTLPSTSWVAPEIGGSTVGTGSTFGSLNAAMPAAGSVGGAGAMSAALPTGAVIGTGANGGAIGATYLAGANGMVATNALGQPILASSVGLDGFAPSSSPGLGDAFNALKLGKILLNSGKGGSTGGSTGGYAGHGGSSYTVPRQNPYLNTAQQYTGLTQTPDAAALAKLLKAQNG